MFAFSAKFFQNYLEDKKKCRYFAYVIQALRNRFDYVIKNKYSFN